MPFDDPQSADSPTLIRDPDEAAEVFSKAGIDLQFERTRNRGAFSVDFKNYAMGGAELVCTQWGTDTWLRVNFTDRMAVIVSPDDFTPSVFTISGDDVPASTKSAPIMQPDRKINVFRPEQTPLFVVSADLKELQRHFRDITGTDSGQLEFASGLDRDTPEGKRFQRIINYAVNELQEEPSGLRQLQPFRAALQEAFRRNALNHSQTKSLKPDPFYHRYSDGSDLKRRARVEL